MEKTNFKIVDVSSIRKSFSELRSKFDELQRILFSAEQTFINEYCDLERVNRTLHELLERSDNGKV